MKLRLLSLVMVFAMAFSFTVFAASEQEAVIDSTKSTSLTLYKYDLTSAEEDEVWTGTSYVSTGIFDREVNAALAPYALQGVEFSFLKITTLEILKENENPNHKVMPLYGFHEDVATNSRATTEFLSILGLTTDDAYKVSHDSKFNRTWYFESDTLINGLSGALLENATETKAALERYMDANGGTAMPETDETGKSQVTGLSQGLYLVVETSVPENVTCTTAPFLVSLPMTTTDGEGWNYDVTVYPKNETGMPTLEKTVREAKEDTGKNNGKADDITDGYRHTATGSAGDVMEYQIISTLPTITSPATALTTWTFEDSLSPGLSYLKNDVKIEVFEDPNCIHRVAEWTANRDKFNVDYTPYSPETGTQMTIEMTSSGLAEINSSVAVYEPGESLFRGYSDCTMRITYSVLVNPDDSLVLGDEGNPNEVTLTWQRSNRDYLDTLTDCCHVYSYGLDVTKKFSDSKGNYDNVKFLLRNATDGYYLQGVLNRAEGIYYVTGHTEKESEATLFSPMSGDSNTGHIQISGLEDDTWVLTETATDKGYVLLKENVVLTLSAGEGTDRCDTCETTLLTGSAQLSGQDVTMETLGESKNAVVPLTVTNTRSFALPKTGGSNSHLLYLLGAICLIAGGGAIGFGVWRKKKKK